MVFFRGSSTKRSESVVATSNDAATGAIIREGNLEFQVEKGGNGAQESYQEVTGAPVEKYSPLGYSVGPLTIILFNISKMIGTGVYSTRTHMSCTQL